jgi:hypothetical protein
MVERRGEWWNVVVILSGWESNRWGVRTCLYSLMSISKVPILVFLPPSSLCSDASGVHRVLSTSSILCSYNVGKQGTNTKQSMQNKHNQSRGR